MHNCTVAFRNKDFENVITIDLHGQHVKQAMRLFKLHLLFGTYVPCKYLSALHVYNSDAVLHW